MKKLKFLVFTACMVFFMAMSFSSVASCFIIGELEEGETRDGWCNWRPTGYQCEAWGAAGTEPNCDG